MARILDFEEFWKMIKDECAYDHHWGYRCKGCNRSAAEAKYNLYLRAMECDSFNASP